MKKPDEIKKDIIDCMDEAIVVSESGDAHDLLDFSDKAHVCMAVTLTYIQQLEAELAAVKRERDAAVRAISDAQHYIKNLCAVQYGLQQLENWDYCINRRGACSENTEVKDEN